MKEQEKCQIKTGKLLPRFFLSINFCHTTSKKRIQRRNSFLVKSRVEKSSDSASYNLTDKRGGLTCRYESELITKRRMASGERQSKGV